MISKLSAPVILQQNEAAERRAVPNAAWWNGQNLSASKESMPWLKRDAPKGCRLRNNINRKGSLSKKQQGEYPSENVIISRNMIICPEYPAGWKNERKFRTF